MKKWLIFLLVIVVGGYYAYKWLYPTYSWHQKLTVEIETPEGLVTGSSVIAVTVDDVPDILPNVARKLGLRGEATIVELPKGRYLFALLSYNAFFAANVFEESKQYLGISSERWAKVITRLQNRTEPRTVPRKLYPMLVTFSDINDPKSVQKVTPDHLAIPFGAGIRLKRMTLQITGEPVTKGRVEKVLGWLNRLNNHHLDGDRYHRADAINQLANSLNILDFVRGQ